METDVLVIGGGIAGCFAAIKARHHGVQVTLVDKGYVGRSGQTPFASGFAVYCPEWGHDLRGWMEQVNNIGEYVNNRLWTEVCFRDSQARYQDLLAWGVDFDRNSNGEPARSKSPLGPCETLWFRPGEPSLLLRREALRSGAKILDRTMVVDLLKKDGRVAGALGIPVDKEHPMVMKARAVVLAAGSGAFKPAGWPVGELTSDSDAMAYRVGAEITGKEFVAPYSVSADSGTNISWGPGRISGGRLLNAHGEELTASGAPSLQLDLEAHAGRAPVYREIDGQLVPLVGGAASGMSVHKAEGVWPQDINCASSVPGLFVAGDCCGNMQSGARYASAGLSLMGASVTGARAGAGAADHVRHVGELMVDEGDVERLQEGLLAPLRRKGGFSSRWLTQILQNTMTPYFVMYVKRGDRLQAALTMVEFYREELAPKLVARDAHELRLAHETKNMLLNAEMRLRSSLFRTESRGCHYREDYPRRDDANWLAWVKMKEERGKMKVYKEPIPRGWWPDPSKPYQERYPFRFPGE